MSRRRQRGQLVLIAAILVATAVLGAVVLLNAVHSSPDVKAQTDAQSLSTADRTVGDIRQDLRDLFFGTNGTDAQYPFATASDLGNATGAYSSDLAAVVSRDSPAVTAVELLPAESTTGGFVSGAVPTSNTSVIENASSLPYLSINASAAATPRITIVRTAAPDREIVLDGSSTEYDDRTGDRRECDDISGRARLELTRGSGAIRGEDGAVCEVFVYDPTQSSEYDVAIDAANGDGRFNASGGGTPVLTGDRRHTGVVVNPTFEVTYRDPSVTYRGNVTLFRGDRR
ncbi:hypothetical protein GRX03_08505 [Halovenus sp. WSH3]|uniref:Uncharacterized protein n=1 Tax=Halovenus carboxidivorans TaxID=2692199 RepID=A0A6B0T8J2_9EURY|nr:hypothetical protein [Halovenus carboxidivorans]MXR51642.1 hypothetical protein [Halovenus carboxidivorans]